eukprot:656561-Alexandrium_andersonii.AAC.1
MSASLVGSEMCIRDRKLPIGAFCATSRANSESANENMDQGGPKSRHRNCLLYTSDAADDM